MTMIIFPLRNPWETRKINAESIISVKAESDHYWHSECWAVQALLPKYFFSSIIAFQFFYPCANFSKPKIKLLKKYFGKSHVLTNLIENDFFFIFNLWLCICQGSWDDDVDLYRYFVVENIRKSVLWSLVSVANAVSVGKIRILNKTGQMVRVHLSPSPTWSYYQPKNNRTLRRDPNHKIGTNSIL